MRYKEYFQDFDPLRKGVVKKNKFRSVVFQTMKLALDEKVLDRLEQHYTDKDDSSNVNYLQFLDDIDIVFTLPVTCQLTQEREKDPTTTPPVFDYTQTSPTKPAVNQQDDL